jgi:GNAT superfamily N-acetyltransferase
MTLEETTRHEARDGRSFLIRPLEPADKGLVLEALGQMSELSRYRRFLAPKPNLSASELAYLTEADHDHHEALIAIDLASGAAVGVARYVRLASEPDAAEAAIVVVDQWQRAGVGTALLRRLAGSAGLHGITRFRAAILRENAPVFRLLDGLRLPYSLHTSQLGAGTAEIEVGLGRELEADQRATPMLKAPVPSDP